MATLSSPVGWRSLPTRPIDPDQSIRWGCSGKGWHCCVDKVISMRPYDVVRLRHAVHQPSEWLINERYVTFVWDGAGAFMGYLAQVAYERTRKACVFYDEITNVRAKEIRENDPERFASLPPNVQQAADSTANGEWRVAGLCNAYMNRPEACRGFPFQRDPARERRQHEFPMLQIFRCGTCALSTPTTPRAVMTDNQLEPYWRADDAFLEVMRYLRSRGASNVTHANYERLPITDAARGELWASMYAPDTNAAIAAAYPEQWHADLDIDGDMAIYRMLLEQVLDRVDAMVTASGIDPVALGVRGDPLRARPDLDRLMDPERALFLPVIAAG